MTDKLSLNDIHEYAHKLFKSFNNLNFKSNYNYALQAFYLEKKLYVVRSNDYQYTLVETDSEEQAIKKCFIAGAKENGIVWHDLRKNPNDLPKRCGTYLTNIGVLDFSSSFGSKWYTLMCEACDFREDVSDEVIAWCDIPKFEEEE